MGWQPGTKLGPYEIVAPLGSGGMGEVHRARDTRLDREVAIKLIPAALAGNDAFRQRFAREAKAISSLNHPNICTLHDVGQTAAEGSPETGGLVHYLVMELIEGESLADRLVRGPLPLHDVLRYGRQISSALDAAHRHGIIHRDLKPGNVMITKSGAKLLDFGLARSTMGEPGKAGESTSTPTAMATAAHPLTAEGTILGTFQYMAPEQLEGAEADARTDIFALGAVLHEMATGQPAFKAASKTSLIAAIVSSQPPPISTIVPTIPPALDHVVRRCLEKDPDDRWQSAHDVAGELQWIGEAGSQAGVAVPITRRRKAREKLAWGVAGISLLAALALALTLWTAPRTTQRAFRGSISPPPDQSLIPFDLMGLSLSPDGMTLAFVASGHDGRKQIWLRRLSEMTARALSETEGAGYPFWSPDGQNLAFFSEGKLKRIDLRGGSPRVLADAPSGRGGSWGSEGVILYAPNITSPILRIPADGGSAEPVTTLDQETEVTHRWPVFLPDGSHFLYVSRARRAGQGEVGRLMLAEIGSPEPSVLIEDASNALYVEPGFLIYGRSANLYAWRFDAGSLQLTGQPIPIVPDKLSYWEGKNFVPFTASDDGTLVYLAEAIRPTEIRWFDRDGRPLEALGSPGFYVTPRISPDGRRIAYMQGDSPQSATDIWIRDLDLDRTFRLTQQSGFYSSPAWTPDSARIAFLCQPKGVQDLCVRSAGPGGDIEILYESSTWKTSGSWMPNGKGFLFALQDPETNQDILMLPGGAGAKPLYVVRTPFSEDFPFVSPDGRRLAYVSDQSGRFEVYVRSLEGSPEQWQISTAGGQEPRWRSDGKELVYAASDGFVTSVPLQTEPAFRPGSPVRLFALPEPPDVQTPIFEDMTADGKRLLLNVPTTSRASIVFHAILGWTTLLQDEGE